MITLVRLDAIFNVDENEAVNGQTMAHTERAEILQFLPAHIFRKGVSSAEQLVCCYKKNVKLCTSVLHSLFFILSKLKYGITLSKIYVLSNANPSTLVLLIILGLHFF